MLAWPHSHLSVRVYHADLANAAKRSDGEMISSVSKSWKMLAWIITMSWHTAPYSRSFSTSCFFSCKRHHPYICTCLVESIYIIPLFVWPLCDYQAGHHEGLILNSWKSCKHMTPEDYTTMLPYLWGECSVCHLFYVCGSCMLSKCLKDILNWLVCAKRLTC